MIGVMVTTIHCARLKGVKVKREIESPFAAFFFSKLIELTTAIGGQ